MEEIEKEKNRALEKLRKIQTIEDVKEQDQEIVDTMVGFFTGGIEILRAWFQDILTLEPEQKQMEIVKFQDSNFLADEDIENELDRISSIPGAEEHLEPFMGQLEERLGPVMEETQEIMEKLMNDLGDAMMGSMEGVFEGMAEDMDEEEEVYIDGGRSFKDDDIQFYGIRTLNEVRDKNDFEYYKDNIGFMAEESINSDLDGMKSFNAFIEEDGGSYSDYREDIRRLVRRKDLLIEGIKTEMDRIATIPKAAREAVRIRDETLARIDPQVKEIESIHKEMKRNFLTRQKRR